MANKRGCPLFKGADVVVEEDCFRCGHHDKESTACDWYHHTKLVKLGHMKQSEFEEKHKNMGVS